MSILHIKNYIYMHCTPEFECVQQSYSYSFNQIETNTRETRAFKHLFMCAVSVNFSKPHNHPLLLKSDDFGACISNLH